MLRFASLASGSAGNALVVEAGGTRVLLDCGLSIREATRRLAALGLAPGDLDAIAVTHEHDDHAGGVFGLAAAYRLPVYLTHGTCRALRDAGRTDDAVELRFVDGRGRWPIGGLELCPYTVPHDAREPVQYLFSDGTRRLGVLTDIGTPTAHVVETLSGCDALVLECNHDLDMLWGGEYPRRLKQRIAGVLGHLDNATAGQLLGMLDRRRLQHVVAAHLSERNNRPELARAALARELGCDPARIGVASQDGGFDWRCVE